MMTTLLFAAALSLSSTNDYLYISMPTNGRYSVDGVGVGPNGDYLVMRREDWLFLEECVRERKVVSDWLSLPATTNNAPSGDYSNAVTIYPWPDGYMFNALGGQFMDLFGSVTNQAYSDFRCPSQGTYSSATKEVVEEYSNENVFSNMYVGGIKPASRKMETYNAVAGSQGHSWILPNPEIVIGVLTNAYSDIIANDRLIWRQPVKYGTSGFTRTVRSERSCSSFASGYSASDHDFIYVESIPYKEENFSYPSSAWLSVNYFYMASIDVQKIAYCGFENRVLANSGEGERTGTSEDMYNTCQNFVVMLSDPIGGAQIVSADAAFVVLRYQHIINRYTHGPYANREVLTNIVKHVMKPISLSKISSHDGLTTYGFTLPVVSTRSEVLEVVKDQMKGQRWLANQIETPEFPTTYNRVSFNSDINRMYESMLIDIEGVIGVFEMRYHARVLE